MSATPNFVKVPQFVVARPTTANTSSAGGGTLGTDIYNLLTANAAGTLINTFRVMPVGSTAFATSAATVIRFYMSKVGPTGTTTAADTHQIGELFIPSVSVDQSTGITNYYELPYRKAIDSGWYVHCTTHVVPAANTGWVVSVDAATLAA